MIGDISLATNIYIITGFTDMRKSIDGLHALVMDKLHEEPDRFSIYLFCGRRADRIKILLRESLSPHFCNPNHFDKNPCILKFK